MSVKTNYLQALMPQIENRFSSLFDGVEKPPITTRHVTEVVPLTFSNNIFDVTFDNYLKHHSSDKWIVRKALAIPKALYSGVVMSICHLFAGIFMGALGNRFGRDEYIFSSLRDIEEMIGQITTLFNDTYGSYLVANAQVMKEFYHTKIGSRPDDMANNPILQRHVTLLEETTMTTLNSWVNEFVKNHPSNNEVYTFTAVTWINSTALDTKISIDKAENIQERLSSFITNRMTPLRTAALSLSGRLPTLQIRISPENSDPINGPLLFLRRTLSQDVSGITWQVTDTIRT